MGVDEVHDVDVVPDCGPIGGGIVGPEDGEALAPTESTWSATGMTWVSGSWSSPCSSVAPATLKYREQA